ncbi:MAG: Ig-like domain-containing protein, partial [Verrucomicrobiota bacterium]
MRSRVFIPAILLLALLPAALAQTQLIQNGGFASASYAPWVLTGSGIAVGNGYLSMGNYSGATQSAYQTVTFPTNLIAARLSLYYEIVSTDPNGDDTLTIDIMDTNFIVLEQLGYATSEFTNAWVGATNNFITYPGSNTLSSYAGQTVEVYFAVTTDANYGYLTSFNLTDVSLLAATTANIPPNDDFANATPILTDAYAEDVTTTYASKEPGEANHAGNAGGHSVWWTWTAPAIGTVSINTTGSSFDTVLAVYTAASPANITVSNLTCVCSNNGGVRGVTYAGLASLQFTVPTAAEVGTQYYIALDGYGGQSGGAVFNFTFSLDTNAPTVAFTSPANGAAVTNSSVLVKGTSHDKVAVASVQYSLANANGGSAWELATTTNQWTNWTAAVTDLIPGTNLVTLEAFNTSGIMSALASRVFDYDVPTALTLSTNGRGTISISGTTNVASASNGQLLDLAFPYTLTAKAAAGFAFNGWTGSMASNSTKLTFIMATNLSFTANFVDVQKPTNSITAPTPGQRWSNSLFQITGKAVDNVAVAGVYYQLDGGSWTPATTTNDWTNWRANVTLAPGTNTVRAYAVDTSGHLSTPTNSVSFFYVVTAPLVVQTNGRGTVSPDYNGRSLAIGSNYFMTATAATGFKFTNWTGGTNLPWSVLTNNAKLTFLMASNLNLIANFVDVEPPGIAIISPTLNQRWSNSTFTVKGTASDNVQVANVFFQHNGGSWTPANSTNTWTNWTANPTLSPGTNVIRACAEDTSGNRSATNKVGFLYVPTATLTVQTNGLGGITPVDNGKLLAIGTNYTLTAAQGHNWLFSNWVASGSEDFVSNTPVLRFTMQSNLVLAANFVTNPFLAVAGVYHGLFHPASGVTEASSGFITATIASNSAGAFTAKLLLDGGSNSFSGSFDLTGRAQTNFTIAGQNVSVVLSLDFNPADALMG